MRAQKNPRKIFGAIFKKKSCEIFPGQFQKIPPNFSGTKFVAAKYIEGDIPSGCVDTCCPIQGGGGLKALDGPRKISANKRK